MTSGHGNQFNNPEIYELFVGRWSRLVARQFIAWLNVPAGLRWLDVGAGTGVLTKVILEEASPARIIGVDTSADFLQAAVERVRDDRVEFRQEDAGDLSFDGPAFDVAVSGLVLNFVPAPDQAVQGIMRVVQGGGMVAAYVWDYGGQMEMMRQFWNAAAVVDPASVTMDSGQRFTIARPDALRALFQDAALEAVDVIPITIETRFRDFDDYWGPILGAQGSLSKYVRALSDDTRAALRDQLLKQLPVRDDGSIPLVARAWAVKGVKPAWSGTRV